MAQQAVIHEPRALNQELPPVVITVAPREERIVLKLRPRQKKTVCWKEDTVDNELMNKKKSKKCCIFHKPRAFDESSSDEEDEGGHRHHNCNENHYQHHEDFPQGSHNGEVSHESGPCSSFR